MTSVRVVGVIGDDLEDLPGAPDLPGHRSPRPHAKAGSAQRWTVPPADETDRGEITDHVCSAVEDVHPSSRTEVNWLTRAPHSSYRAYARVTGRPERCRRRVAQLLRENAQQPWHQDCTENEEHLVLGERRVQDPREVCTPAGPPETDQPCLQSPDGSARCNAVR